MCKNEHRQSIRYEYATSLVQGLLHLATEEIPVLDTVVYLVTRVYDDLALLAITVCPERTGVEVSDGSTKPFGEELREISIWNLIVIRWITKEEWNRLIWKGNSSGIVRGRPAWSKARPAFYFTDSDNPLNCPIPRASKRVTFSKIPDHGQSLAAECARDELTGSDPTTER